MMCKWLAHAYIPRIRKKFGFHPWNFGYKFPREMLPSLLSINYTPTCPSYIDQEFFYGHGMKQSIEVFESIEVENVKR